MKILVDSLPYYEALCPFRDECRNQVYWDDCPRYWDKYKVNSDENPHKCKYLIEATYMLKGGNINEHD